MQTIVSMGGNPVDPSGLANAPGGNLYVGDFTALGGALLLVNTTTGMQTTIASGGLISGVIDIAVESSGTVLVENQFDRIIRVNPADGMQTLLASGGDLVGLNGLGVGIDGEIYVSADPDPSLPSKIIRIDPITGMQTVVSSGGNFGFLGGLVQAPIPEPASLWLCGLGLVTLLGYGWA
jgi:hypothetical protein